MPAPTEKMIAAFRKGDGDYIHLQGPAPQQLVHDGAGHIVAALGDAIGPCAFRSLAATREWLVSEEAKAFMRAYRKARAWLIATPAAEVAKVEAPYFRDIDPAVLTETVATYQKLGNWTPHVEITRPAFEATLDIFKHAGLITKRSLRGRGCATAGMRHRGRRRNSRRRIAPITSAHRRRNAADAFCACPGLPTFGPHLANILLMHLKRIGKARACNRGTNGG